MGCYRLQEDACLHVMISDRGSAARAAGDARDTEIQSKSAK